MDRLLSLFSLYDLLGFILPGGLAVSGTYWALAGVPGSPGTAAAFALIGAFFIAGELVQGAAVVWERVYWRRVGWPSTQLLSAGGDEDLRQLVGDRLALEHGDEVRQLGATTQFELARADLRRLKLDGRSELMNARYALVRGLATAAAYLVGVFAVAAIWDDHKRNLIAMAIALAALPVFLLRFHRSGHWFARQVLRDYAALPPPGQSRWAEEARTGERP